MTERTAATTSEAEEMYIITVARATEAGRTGPIPVAAIAETLGVSVASANEMVRKLAGRELVAYEPYRGVSLTEIGEQVANRVLRIRRLWATFLAEHLGFAPDDADTQACDLEHVTTPDAADRLAEFLGDPPAGPLGHRIPQRDTGVPRTLADLAVGEPALVRDLTGSDGTKRFLESEGIRTGATISVTATGASGVLVAVSDHLVHVGAEVAATVAVVRGT
jgi:DtxR family Mn-dependent transcriptional regulator